MEVTVHVIFASVIGIVIILGKPSGSDFLIESMAGSVLAYWMFNSSVKFKKYNC
jgi:UDP-N-acetylmuramyl pentapeptide phosphotransferase/UDP-N-acetylglucosamine-1-phosphate transferase